MPNGAAGLYLLAFAQEQQGNQVEAFKNYGLALSQDPTLWCAYERMCKLQPQKVESSKLFKENHQAINQMNQYIFPQEEQSPQSSNQRDAANDPPTNLPPQTVKGMQSAKENQRDVVMLSDKDASLIQIEENAKDE